MCQFEHRAQSPFSLWRVGSFENHIHCCSFFFQIIDSNCGFQMAMVVESFIEGEGRRMLRLFLRWRKWFKVFLVMSLLKEIDIWQMMMNLCFPPHHLNTLFGYLSDNENDVQFPPHHLKLKLFQH